MLKTLPSHCGMELFSLYQSLYHTHYHQNCTLDSKNGKNKGDRLLKAQLAIFILFGFPYIFSMEMEF